MAIQLQTEQDRPLNKLSCRKTECEKGLHCFRPERPRRSKKKKAEQSADGLFDGLATTSAVVDADGSVPEQPCLDCGARPVDWPRFQRRDLSDVDHTVQQLKNEWIRHHFFNVQADQTMRNFALRKGRNGLLVCAKKRLRDRLRVGHPREGFQTPWNDDILSSSQHATACCCRRCVSYWHGIPADTPLSEADIDYLAALCVAFVDDRLPGLPDQKQRVPRRPRETP